MRDLESSGLQVLTGELGVAGPRMFAAPGPREPAHPPPHRRAPGVAGSVSHRAPSRPAGSARRCPPCSVRFRRPHQRPLPGSRQTAAPPYRSASGPPQPGPVPSAGRPAPRRASMWAPRVTRPRPFRTGSRNSSSRQEAATTPTAPPLRSSERPTGRNRWIEAHHRDTGAPRPRAVKRLSDDARAPLSRGARAPSSPGRRNAGSAATAGGPPRPRTPLRSGFPGPYGCPSRTRGARPRDATAAPRPRSHHTRPHASAPVLGEHGGGR